MNHSGRRSEEREIIPLPLVIGVTGHRDLREEDRVPLEAQVRQIFAEFQSRYPSTHLLLLSPLAEGADRLVARVALEKGVRLIVPLPMPQALYEEDFQTKASRKEFNQLLQQAERSFELPLLNEAREKELWQQGPVRDHQYAQVGAYIVLHCQVLIALWDGNYTDQVGGTSQVVQFQLGGVPEIYAPLQSPLDEPESGFVYHIVTPRLKNPIPAGQPFELIKLPPMSNTPLSAYYEHGSATDKHDSNNKSPGKKQRDQQSLDEAMLEFKRIFENLDTFNRDRIDLGTRLDKKQEKSKTDLLGSIDMTTLDELLKVTLDRYARLYAVADSLAIYFKRQAVNTRLFLFRLFFIALIFFNVYAHLLGEQWGGWRFLSLAFYVVFLFIAYHLWYYRATRGRYKNKGSGSLENDLTRQEALQSRCFDRGSDSHASQDYPPITHYQNKYLDYRALAEGLRVQFFWRLGDISDTVAAHYLRKQRSELDWIRNSIRVANLLYDSHHGHHFPDSSLSSPENRYRLILQHWVNHQSQYFTKTAILDHETLEKKEWWVRGSFLTGIAVALALLILQFLQLFSLSAEWIRNLLIVIMGLALVLAALKEGYSDKMAYVEESKQYQRMSRLFLLASQHLEGCLKQEKFQDAEYLIQELGEEALAENGDWVILHRARPINVPIGG